MKSIDVRYINKFTGYKNYRDITNLAVTDIIAGSQNMFVEDGAKLSSRGGMRYFGTAGTVGTNTNVAWTLAHRIHSDYDKFVNNQGTIMPFRVFYSGTTAQGDVLETWLPDFNAAGDALTTKKWYQVSATVPVTSINSVHRWYFAEWYDSLNTQNRIVFTYGTNLIGSYSGGYAPVIGTTPTTITTNGTWRSKGFIEAPEGVNSVVVNGVTHALTAGDFSTNTITVASTAGIVITNVAFQALNSDTASFGIADYCAALNNQVYYEDWNQRNVFISWNRNRIAFLGDTIYIGTSGLDDAVFGGTFTGTSTDTYIVNIDSVDPTVNTQSFQSTGPNGLNNGVYDTSGYSGTAGVTNHYKVLTVADMTLALVTASIVGTFRVGETVIGSGSQAIGQIVAIFPGLQPGIDGLAVDLLFGSFDIADTITGQSSGATGTLAVNGVSGQDWIQYSKNDVVTTITSAGVTGPIVPISVTLVTNLTDGLVIRWGNYFGHAVGDAWLLEIKTGTPDTFSWSLNGISQGSLIPITGGAQVLSQGITVNFVQTTGHAVSDSWRVIAYPLVIKGWRDFYFTQPVRLPGEGFKLQLDSNGFSAMPQEKHMYLSSAAGQYYTVSPQLSADLQSETFVLERLKTEQQNKPLFPYLMQSTKNFLSIVSTEKTWDILGRQKFLELPQSKTLSDHVRVDFETGDWEDSNIKYIDRKQYFVRPKQGDVLVYDDFMKYWHSPMVFGRRVSSIAFIDGKIIGHSNERNESYELFTVDRNDLDIYPLDCRIIAPYYDFGKRFQPKATTAIAFDGYMDGNPHIKWRFNAGIGGCQGKRQEEIDPLFCVPEDTASLGKSSLGFHGLGNSPTNVINHFHYGRTFSSIEYYLRNIEVTCDQADQRWAITSYGTDVDINQISNTTMFNK